MRTSKSNAGCQRRQQDARPNLCDDNANTQRINGIGTAHEHESSGYQTEILISAPPGDLTHRTAQMRPDIVGKLAYTDLMWVLIESPIAIVMSATSRLRPASAMAT
jgi:hypothetical protein